MKIICIGRNYADHAKELNNPLPKEPVFFCKPDSAILPKGNPFFIPDWSNEIHFEVELVLRICRLGKHIQPEFANRYYDGIGLGIDFTARDIQEELKAKGLPWEKAKAFDGSAVIGDKFFTPGELASPIQFSLERSGNILQQGSSDDMIFSFDQIITYVSQFMTLKIGDFIFTGTPSGVGLIHREDLLTGKIHGQEIFSLRIK